MRKIILHVGYPKTATTTLQNHVFNKLDNLFYLGKYNHNDEKNFFNDTLFLLIKYLIHGDEIPEDKKFQIQNNLNKVLQESEKETFLLSEEALFGSVIGAPSYLSLGENQEDILVVRKKLFLKNLDKYVKAIATLKDILKEIDIELEILIFLRNQYLAILSYYVHCEYFYDEILDSFNLNIDKNAIHVFLFEEILDDKVETFQRLNSILDNHTIDIQDVFRNNHDNKKTKSSKLSYITASKKEISISIEQINMLKSIYKTSNEKLMKKYSLPINKYDYL